MRGVKSANRSPHSQASASSFDDKQASLAGLSSEPAVAGPSPPRGPARPAQTSSPAGAVFGEARASLFVIAARIAAERIGGVERHCNCLA